MLPKVLIGISKVFATIWVLNIKFVNCIEIDNQLKVITNDCYERLAIGQRLKPQDIYKKVDANTVPKCQKECTIEGDNCKAFSYGISIKGNSTCQLGKNFIRETADLQPIGTIADVDFDLYIKKLGCKLVVDPHVNKISKPNFNGQFLHSTSASSGSFNQEHVPSSTPSYPSLHQHGVKKPDERPSKNNDSSSNKPLQDVQKPTINYGLSIPNIETVHSSNGNNNNVKKPPSNSKFTQYGVQNGDWNDDVQHVQGSLVSISTGPLSYLHPVHEILIGKNPYLYGQTKPYRPSGNIPGQSNFFNDKVGSYHTTNNMRPYDRYKDHYGSSNEYFNDNPETYRDYSKYKNPNNLEGTRNPEYDYNIFRRPGQSSYQQEIPYVPSSNGYKDELPDRNKYNQHNRPFLEDPYDRYQPQQTNNFEYGSGKFTHEKGKPSYDTHRGYDDKRKRNPYDSEASKDKQINPLGTPNNSFGSYNGGRYPMTSNVYNTDSPNRLSDSYNNKPGYYESHNQFFDERYPPRPIDYDNPQYGEKPLRPQHYGYGYGHQEYPPIIDDRKDGALNKRPYYGDHKTNYGSFDSSQGYPGPPKIHYSDQRPPRPHYNIWEPETRPVNSDYLFNDEVKYDSTRFVHPNSTFAVRKNDSTHSNDTKLFSHLGTKNNETHIEDSKLKPIVTESVGVDGEKIISIVTQLDSTCFRRVLAGKRVSSRFVKRFLICERIEDCQLECGEEKHFVCEGFNYRLDPTGRGKGECELLDVPLQRLDIGRDVYPDREYDYYERDRNIARTQCQERPRYPDYGVKRPTYDHHGYDRRPEYNYYPNRRYDVGPYKYDRRPSYYDKVDYHENRPPYDYDRRRPYDTPYHHSFNTAHRYNSHSHTDRNDNTKHGIHYLPPNPSPLPIFSPPYGHKSHYSKHNYGSIDNRKYDQGNLDFKKHYETDFHRHYSRNPYNSERRNYYLPPRVGGTKDWGKYGGSYGNFGHNNDHSSKNEIVLNYWSLDNRNDHKPDNGYILPPFKTGSYLPNTALEINVIQDKNPNHIGDNFILPVEPRIPSYNYLKEESSFNEYWSIVPLIESDLFPECSLRSATGFKLAKSIVKKFYAVPNIYECELLCFKERSFACSSYAFRYTISLSSPADNCYLSNKNYKELDYYTDLQPDRDFDIYTMNNMNKCVSPVIVSKYNSDCFWRVRSGQKLDHRVVKESLTVNSIVDCQIECLKSRRFMCRVFSFRFGSPRSDRSFNNCQLSDWPYYEFDSRIDFIPASGFEIYERGSFGHGCEPYHFDIRGRPSDHLNTEVDQLCYIGFGSPARLLPEATKKALKVNDQLECKAECSKLKEESTLHCMSFSFRLHSYGGFNCFLSDIHQRDLLPHIDYIPDSQSRLYAWDNYNPQCTRLPNKKPHGDSHIHISREEIYGNSLEDDAITALDTWKAYSVSGWPCKRGYPCQKNLEAGFWFCKLEGGDEDAWDYCCRPDHQCGYSYGISYPWCYVGPDKTQWRECSDRYYPYIQNLIDRFYNNKKYHLTRPPLHEGSATHQVPQYGERPPPLKPPPFRPGFRPDLPPPPPQERPPQPSLDEYEMQFDEQFLAPPKPGGFGQPRHWPVSYLHKDRPPNITDSKTRMLTPGENKESKSKLGAIQSLIDIINSNELKNVQYQITNESNVKDDILFVKIPLPSNFTKQDKMDEHNNWSKPEPKLEQIDIGYSNVTRRANRKIDLQEIPVNSSPKQNFSAPQPTYRRGYITRTNVTGHRRSTH